MKNGTPATGLYPRRRDPELDPELFRHPSPEYRGVPFWSWNCRLDREQLFRQIEVLADMGLGGVMMHVRTGLDTPYLGPAFLELVRACVERARSMGLRAWLYDEDRWPSGFAGGLVTENETFRAKYLQLIRGRPVGIRISTKTHGHS